MDDAKVVPEITMLVECTDNPTYRITDQIYFSKMINDSMGARIAYCSSDHDQGTSIILVKY
jgi:hypothetical protein